MAEDKYAKIRAEHGDVVVAKIGGVEFIFKTPTQESYEDFQEKVVKDRSNKSAAVREYCLRSLVEPGADALEAAFKKAPATAGKIADQLSTLAGAEIEVTIKKG